MEIHPLLIMTAGCCAAGQLPEGATGIAANHPADREIAGDSKVLFHDDF